MKKVIQILFVTFLLLNISTTSHAFIGATIKSIKGITLLLKTQTFKFSSLFKVGVADSGVRMVDNVATEALSIKKLNQNLISKIKKSEQDELINIIKEDQNVSLANYKNIDDATLETDEINWWTFLHPGWRHLARDFKPDNFIYACETNSGDAYYFSLLPKRNLALVSSTSQMIDSQRLRIKSSSAKGTVLQGFDNKENIDYFFLLPNYQFYAGKHDSDQDILEVFPNGSCYNTEVDFKENTVTFVQYKNPISQEEKTKIDNYLKYYFYICILYIVSVVILLIKNQFIGKSKKRTDKYFYLTYAISVLNIISFNLFGVGAALIILKGLDLAMWAKIVYWIIYIWYIFALWETVKGSYKSIKEKRFSFISNIDLIITIIIFVAGLGILFLT